ncbi:MAG: hypothetical protein FJ368_06920 [Pelagibacterales bacterium]|nr:hypothetical protein [Pelagibacterales bacterium]
MEKTILLKNNKNAHVEQSLTIINDDFFYDLFKQCDTNELAEIKAKLNEVLEIKANTHLHFINFLSKKTKNVLFYNEISYIKLLTLITEKEFLNFKGVGKTTEKEIKQLLSDLGLEFKKRTS